MKLICRYFLVAIAPVWAQVSPTINELPSREFGQPKLLQSLTSIAPNLVEGRELNGPTSIAFDTSVSPPILYVSDTFNHRVLAWRNSAGLTKGDVADLVIGQRDLSSTLPQGPGSQLSTGFAFPSAMVVDSTGNLYVSDAGNSRILRFPAPFKQSGALLQPDLVIGQKTFSSGNQPNEGSLAGAKTLALTISGTPLRTGLALDQAGNLWASDPGNNRVLRFPVQQLAPNTVEPVADLVLGQTDFTSSTVLLAPPNTDPRLFPNSLVQPAGLAFDQAGRLYVTDGISAAFSRVMHYRPPFSTGLAAARILGVVVQVQGQPAPTLPNGTSVIVPQGVFTLGNNAFVSDTFENRILMYDVPENWPAATTNQPSPPAIAVVGQPGFTVSQANQGKREPDNTTLFLPLGGAFNGAEMWVADAGNNRVLAFLPQGGRYGAASRVVGQLDFSFNAPNLIEGKEVFFYNGQNGQAGMVVDPTSNPPHLYVADSFNHRVLGFADARKVQPGTRADIVIGQPDFFRAVVNGTGDTAVVTDTGLLRPTGLVVDAQGNLFVADTGNGRVLRFPAPFSQTGVQRANLVLGQPSMFAKIQDPSQQNMSAPFGLAMFTDGSIAVSDAVHNRVLIFRRSSGGDFRSGQLAAIVLGQGDFNASASSPATSTSGMNSPRHIATDTSDRLYVADSVNNRVMVFTDTLHAANGASSAFQISGLSSPQGVIVSALTGEIWVANSSANTILRFPEYGTLILNPTLVTSVLGSPSPLAVALDKADNLIVAEFTNRIAFYFAKLTFQNAANYNQKPLAPGMLALLYRLGKDFALTPGDGTSLSPWPQTLSDLQVTVNGTPAPIFRVDPSDIAFQVPMNAPTSGTADFLITHPSTGEIVAAATVPMAQQSPGFFTLNAQGTGQVAALNYKAADGSFAGINGPTNPAAVGDTISFYLTGQGFVPNAPPDGVAPSGPVNTPVMPVVGTDVPGAVDPSDVLYSGLGAFAGGWQINVRINKVIPPGIHKIVVLMRDSPSNIGPAGTITTTFYTK